MVASGYSKFIIDSDFPMPAQVGGVVGQVFIPVGSKVNGNSPNEHLSVYETDIDGPQGAEMYRIAVKSSRANIILPGNGVREFYDDAKFSAYIRILPNKKIRCTVTAAYGFTTVEHTTSDINFTFYISGFKLP